MPVLMQRWKRQPRPSSRDSFNGSDNSLLMYNLKIVLLYVIAFSVLRCACIAMDSPIIKSGLTPKSEFSDSALTVTITWFII
jgi:hypothetical protein